MPELQDSEDVQSSFVAILWDDRQVLAHFGIGIDMFGLAVSSFVFFRSLELEARVIIAWELNKRGEAKSCPIGSMPPWKITHK